MRLIRDWWQLLHDLRLTQSVLSSACSPEDHVSTSVSSSIRYQRERWLLIKGPLGVSPAFASLALAKARLVCSVLRVTWLFGNWTGNIVSNLSHILGLESVQSVYHYFMLVTTGAKSFTKCKESMKEVG